MSKSSKSKPSYTYTFVAIVASIIVIAWLQINAMIQPTSDIPMRVDITASNKPKVPEFDMNKHSLAKPDSLWVIVNKSHPLNPINYVPDNLISSHGGTISSRMEYDLNYMFAAAKSDGIDLSVASSYRSYGYQVNLYNRYVSTYGQSMTDTFSARPGYSEHQTGLTIDFGSVSAPACNVNDCYAETTAGEWLANHGLDYGFLLRYPSDKQSITGYKFEPWHYRYIGHYLADQMKKQHITTLEEFFDIRGGQVYQP